MIDRRRFMIGASVATAGVAAGLVATGHNPFEIPSASAAPDERFTYRGRTVVITPLGRSAHITVDGRHGIHVEREGSEFLTHLLPFSSFRTARLLAQAVIDAAFDGLLII